MDRFVRNHPVIDSADRLTAYQGFVAQQMWTTLFLMGTVFVLPLVILGDAVISENHSANWWPIAVMGVPLLMRHRIRDVETRCRSLPTSPTFESAYHAINKVWVDKALPRFAEVVAGTGADAGPTEKLKKLKKFF
jgi:hypothetical protein